MAPEHSLCAPCGEKRRKAELTCTSRPRPPANSTAAGTRRCVAGSPEREAGSATMHAATPGFGRVAASIPPSRTARSASLAARDVGKPNVRSMPRAGLPGSVAGAVCRPSTASRGAPPAPCTNPGARTAITPPAARATPMPPLASVCQETPISARDVGRSATFRGGFGHGGGRTETSEGISASNRSIFSTLRSTFPTFGHGRRFPSPCAGLEG